MINRDETATEPPSKIRTLIRQNSERIGQFAEVAVLPKYRRSTSRSVHRMNSVQSTTTPVIEGLVPLAVVETDSMDAAKMNATVAVSMPDETPHETTKRHHPVFMIALSILQIYLMHFLNTDGISPMLLLGYDPYRRHQIWRFIFMMFVHTRLPQLILNILLQLMLGVLLEIVHGWLPIAVIYFSSVIGGSLFITLFSPNSYVVGASAGVYGLLSSHLSSIILDWNDWNKKWLRLAMVVFYICLNLTVNWQFTPDDFDTNYAGYVGGAITGFLISILVLKDAKKQQWKKNLRLVCVGILVSIAVVALLVNTFEWRSYLPTEWNKNYMETYTEFTLKRAITSREPSAAREYCKRITKCKILLNRFDAGAFNSTMPSLD
ncbi:rhomboid-related protein 1-like [Bradysia coprophila]|uniref:rhomboid-related protein 1-like n=1 Tax=Bradysia coprophila TaxID=38358 RepID=UPI00187DB9D8|nr:rhomboid-related protein 1-like [Bradysia coprophila]XP_037035299.1 rhomboid-related protein 1-like [Bradysia coprophila]